MTVQDFLRKLDTERLFEAYYGAYCGGIMDELSREQHKTLFDAALARMKTMPVQMDSNLVMFPMESLDDQYEDKEIGEGKWIGKYWHRICMQYTFELIRLDEITSLPEMKHIDNDDNYPHLPYQTYGYEFDPREEILGVKLLFEPGDHPYEYAADLINELTFFGYDDADHDRRAKEEIKELNRRIEEYEKDPESHSHAVNIDKLMVDDGMSKQEREEEMAFARELLVRSCNMEIDQYNRRIRPELMKLMGK